MPFNQNFYGSIGTNANVENLNGTLTINGNQVLTVNSGATDLARQLTNLVAAVEGLSGADAQTKTKAAAEIKAAEQEAKSDKPRADAIKEHLDKASSTLKSAAETTSSALSLAKVLLEVGKWAIAIFA